MQEGDTELGGLQIPHGNNVNPPTPTPGPQPVVPAAPQNPQPVPQSSPQPTPQLSTPQFINQPVSQPADQLFSQTFSPENHTTDQSVIGGQTPQPQTFERQFQSRVQSSTQSTESGDVVLYRKIEKKRRWIVWIVVSAVLCTTLVALLLFISFRDNENAALQDLNKINEEISSYSDAIMYGDGRQVDLSTSTYSDTVDYKFRREIMSGNQEYIEKVINEFDSLNNLIIEDKDLSLTDDDKNYLKVYRDKLQFLEIYVDNSNEDHSIIIDKIINDGKDETISYLETQYSEYIDSDNTSLSDYFLYKIEHEKLSIDILLRTDIGECTTDDIVSASCEVEPLMTDEETLQMQEIEDEMRIIVITNIKYIINGCWDIYDMVNGVKNV